MAGNTAAEPGQFLSTERPARRHRRLALAAFIVSAIAFVALAPFARVQLAPYPGFIAAYQAALVLADLVTATLLIGQFAIVRSRALLVLSCGYVFTASIAAIHALTFPGLFSPTGWFGAGPQTTAWLYMFWHAGFPLFVIGYALLKERAEIVHPQRVGLDIVACVASTVSAAVVVAFLATAELEIFPAIMHGNRYSAAMVGVVSTVWALSGVAAVVLWRRRPHSVLDLWLLVVMSAWIFDVGLSAVLNGGRFDVGFYAGRLYGLVAALFVLAMLLTESARLYARLVHKSAELNELNETLERRIAARTRELHEIAQVSATAREDEKRRIARELHDELGQLLAAVKIDIGLFGERVRGDGALEERIAATKSLVDSAVVALRRISADLRPLVLDDLGLVPAAQWLVQSFQKRHGVACELRVDPPELELDERRSTALFRIMQESLTNVGRHAGASRVEVTLRHAGDHVHLRVSDDGRGFDAGGPRKPASSGLVGLRERTYLVDGQIRIDTAPGRGTTIEVSIPVQAGRPEPALVD